MHQETGRQQRDVFGYRQAHPAQYEDHQQASIGEMLDVRGNQTRQASVPLRVMIAQHPPDLIDRQPFIGKFGRLQRLSGADRAMPAMVVAIAIEQVPMADFLVATAVTMKLRQQSRIFFRDLVGLARRPEETRRDRASHAALGRRGTRVSGRMHRPRSRTERQEHHHAYHSKHPFWSASFSWLAAGRRVVGLGHHAHRSLGQL